MPLAENTPPTTVLHRFRCHAWIHLVSSCFAPMNASSHLLRSTLTSCKSMPNAVTPSPSLHDNCVEFVSQHVLTKRAQVSLTATPTSTVHCFCLLSDVRNPLPSVRRYCPRASSFLVTHRRRTASSAKSPAMFSKSRLDKCTLPCTSSTTRGTICESRKFSRKQIAEAIARQAMLYGGLSARKTRDAETILVAILWNLRPPTGVALLPQLCDINAVLGFFRFCQKRVRPRMFLSQQNAPHDICCTI